MLTFILATAKPVVNPNSASNIINGSLVPGCGSNCPKSTSLITTTAPAVVNLLLYVVGAIAIIMIIIGGMRYVLSSGNPAQVQEAKNTILYAIVGLVLALGAYAIVTFVTGRLGI